MKSHILLESVALTITLLLLSLVQSTISSSNQPQDEEVKSSLKQNVTQKVPEQQGRSRGGRMLDLDHLAGDIGKDEKAANQQSVSGQRQSRILNEDLDFTPKDAKLDGRSKNKKGKKKMAISGFIPIVSLEGAKEGKHFETEDDEQEDEREEAQHQPDTSSSIKNQLVSSYGGQTSMGHASFGYQPQPQPSEQQSWQQVVTTAQNNEHQPSDSGRARKLLGSSGILANLANIPKRPFAPSPFGPSPQASQFMPPPPPQLQGPMNVPQLSTSLVGPQSLVDSSVDCICVPFFQCKNGFLTESQLSKSQLQQIVGHMSPSHQMGNQYQVPRSSFPNGQQTDLNANLNQQQAQQISSFMTQVNNQAANFAPNPNRPSEQQIVNELIYDQLKKNLESGNLEQQLQLQDQSSPFVTVDERSKSGGQQMENSTLLEGDLQGRSLLNPLGKRSGSQQRCGIMRTCCRIPPTLSQMSSPSHNHQQFSRPPQTMMHNPRLEAPNHSLQNVRPQYQILQSARLQPPRQQHQQQLQQLQPQFVDDQPEPAALQASSFQQQFANPQSTHLTHPVGSFMAGRCGTKQTIGISGRVQNAAPAPGSETTAEFGEFPSHVAILKRISPGDSLFVCSAVLISNQWIATAAHCVKKQRPEELKVRLGEWDVNRDDEFYPFVESNVREIVIHPEFQSTSLINDLALLRLDTQIDPQQMPHITPACLPAPEESFSQQRCWVTGWGKDAFGQGGSFQSVLKKVDLPVVGRQDCEMALRYQTKLGKFFRLHQSAVCAGGERGKDACEGDGGAGLYCVDPESGLTKVAGLVSWGVGCGQRGVPGVYTNLASFYRWIEQVVASSGEESLYLAGNGLADSAFKNLISERSNAALNGTLAGDYAATANTTINQQQQVASNVDKQSAEATDSDANKELESRAG